MLTMVTLETTSQFQAMIVTVRRQPVWIIILVFSYGRCYEMYLSQEFHVEWLSDSK